MNDLESSSWSEGKVLYLDKHQVLGCHIDSTARMTDPPTKALLGVKTEREVTQLLPPRSNFEHVCEKSGEDQNEAQN